MERYWCLRWLGQENAKQVEAVVLKDEVLRLTDIPLVIRLPGMPPAPRGAHAKLDVLRWDEVDLDLEARLLEVVAAPAAEGELDFEEEEESVAAEGADDTVAVEPADPAAPAAVQEEVAEQGEAPAQS